MNYKDYTLRITNIRKLSEKGILDADPTLTYHFDLIAKRNNDVIKLTGLRIIAQDLAFFKLNLRLYLNQVNF